MDDTPGIGVYVAVLGPYAVLTGLLLRRTYVRLVQALEQRNSY